MVMVFASVTKVLYVFRWPVILPPGANLQLMIVHEDFVDPANVAWKFLLENGSELSKKYKIPPEDLILGTP